MILSRGLMMGAAALALLDPFQISVRGASPNFVVVAGEEDRPVAIVRTEALPGGDWRSVKDEAGRSIPIQVEADRSATLILTKLKKGERRRLTLSRDAVGGVGSGIVVKNMDTHLEIATGAGGAILDYQMKNTQPPEGMPPYFTRNGYLHPVFTPSGKMVTADYQSDHPWQRGIWFSWTKTEFDGRQPDFWNLAKSRDGTMPFGTEFVELLRTWSGPVHGGFVSKQRAYDATGAEKIPVLMDTWEVRCYDVPEGEVHARVFDFTSTQICGTDKPLKLPKYHYGGLGVRGSEDWNRRESVEFLTSTGADRAGGDANKADWVLFGGLIGGAPARIAVMTHPSNFRSPEPWRLNPSNPQLCVVPSADGDWEITPEKPFVGRYRFVMFDGVPDSGLVRALWTDFARPVVARIGR